MRKTLRSAPVSSEKASYGSSQTVNWIIVPTNSRYALKPSSQWTVIDLAKSSRTLTCFDRHRYSFIWDIDLSPMHRTKAATIESQVGRELLV